jgi:hypothetical protein
VIPALPALLGELHNAMSVERVGSTYRATIVFGGQKAASQPGMGKTPETACARANAHFFELCAKQLKDQAWKDEAGR